MARQFVPIKQRVRNAITRRDYVGRKQIQPNLISSATPIYVVTVPNTWELTNRGDGRGNMSG